MLATLLVVAAFAAAGALGLVVATGGRWRRDGVLAALALAVPGAILTGEVAARTLALPSTDVIAAEAVLVAAATVVSRLRPRLDPPGVWLLATLVVAGATYLVAAAEATVAGGLTRVPMALSAGVWGVEAAAIRLARSLAVEARGVAW